MNPLSLARPLANLVHGKPVAVIFEATLRCNSACGYCNLPLNQGRRELTRAEIRRIFSALHAQGVRYVFVQGGEPLVRADIVDVLEDLCELGFLPAVVTNGTRITAALADRLRALPLHVSVSLDTLDRERYRRIRGRDQLPAVLAGIEHLRAHPQPKFITCILSDVNRGDAAEVVTFARERGFMPIVGAYHWSVGAYGKPDAQLTYEVADAVETLQSLQTAGLLPAGYADAYVRDTIDWLSGRSLKRCDAGRYSVAIDASGNVSACLAHPHVGNLLEDGLPDILARLDRDAIQACSDASRCNLACSRFVGTGLRHPNVVLRTLRELKTNARSSTRVDNPH